MARADQGGPGKRAVKWLWCVVWFNILCMLTKFYGKCCCCSIICNMSVSFMHVHACKPHPNVLPISQGYQNCQKYVKLAGYRPNVIWCAEIHYVGLRNLKWKFPLVTVVTMHQRYRQCLMTVAHHACAWHANDVQSRDVNETLAYETETRVRPMYTSDIENRRHRSLLGHRRIGVGKSPVSML